MDDALSPAPALSPPAPVASEAAPGEGAGSAGAAVPAAPPKEPGFEPMDLLFIVVLWGAVLYFFLLRPQKKKERERRAKIDSIKKGDKIMTIGGLHGTVTQVAEDAITLLVDEKKGVSLKFARSAVNEILKPGKEGAIDPDTLPEPKKE